MVSEVEGKDESKILYTKISFISKSQIKSNTQQHIEQPDQHIAKEQLEVEMVSEVEGKDESKILYTNISFISILQIKSNTQQHIEQPDQCMAMELVEGKDLGAEE